MHESEQWGDVAPSSAILHLRQLGSTATNHVDEGEEKLSSSSTLAINQIASKLIIIIIVERFGDVNATI